MDGHVLEEAARARGAFVVHEEVEHLAVFVYPYDFRVLAADVEHGGRFGREAAGSRGVAGYLGDAAVGLEYVSSVAGDGDVYVAALEYVGAAADHAHGFFGAFGGGPARGREVVDEARAVPEHALRRRRADVEPDVRH